MTGVATTAASRLAVRTQPAAVVLTSSCWPMVPMMGTTMVCRTDTVITTTHRVGSRRGPACVVVVVRGQVDMTEA
jgi:hypothetical protein